MKKASLVITILLLKFPFLVYADNFPSKPLTLLIGFDRGGTVYTQAEALAEVLQDILEQPVILQARSGLGGAIAAAMVSQSQSEGYIMLFTPSIAITNYLDNSQTSFQIDDYRYIGAISEDQNALITYNEAPFSNWAEFLEYAKQQNEILYASQNIADRNFINVIAEQENINVRIIPVSGGAGMAPLVLGKDVDLAFSGGTHNRYVSTGEMKVLASTSINRLYEQPDVPTLKELGYDIEMQSLRILAVPQNTPDRQVKTLTDALQKAIEDPRLIQVMSEVIHHPVMFISGDDLHKFVYNQRLQYLDLLTKTEKEN